MKLREQLLMNQSLSRGKDLDVQYILPCGKEAPILEASSFTAQVEITVIKEE